MSVGGRRSRSGQAEPEDWRGLAIDAAGMATWDWDLATGKINRSEGMAALFGLPPGALDGPSVDPLDHVHPDDRPLIDDWRRSPGWSFPSAVGFCGRPAGKRPDG